MRITLLILITSCPYLVCAENHEITLIASKQSTNETNWISRSNIITSVPEHPTTLGLRYGYELLGSGPIGCQMQFTYHASSSADIQTNTHSSYLFMSTPPLKNLGFSTGFLAQWHYGLELGFGAQLRYERLSLGDTSASQVRPWLISRVSYSVSALVVKPVFGIEYNLAMTHKSHPSVIIDGGTGYAYSNSSDVIKSLSPTNEFSLFGGFRF